MALVICADCGRAISDAAPACIHCGRPNVRAVAPTESPDTASPSVDIREYFRDPLQESRPRRYPFFPVATHKFVVLSLCTLGLYDIYWAYQNWRRIKERTSEDLSPFWRAFWAPLWCFSLFGRIRKQARKESNDVRWSPGLLGTLYLVLSFAWRLPDPLWLLSYGSFVPLIAVVQTTQQINSSVAASENVNSSYSGANILTIILGGLIFVLAVAGTLFPAA